MRKRWLLVLALITILLLAVLMWQTPAILRAIPSRYVARLPAPIQTIGARESIELLPTAAAASDIEGLLAETFPHGNHGVSDLPANTNTATYLP